MDYWDSESLRIKLEDITERQARERAEETATRKFYRWVFLTLFLTGIVWWGLLL